MIERILTPEYVLFENSCDKKSLSNHDEISNMRRALNFAQFDYKIYEELRELKKELKKENGARLLSRMMGGD